MKKTLTILSALAVLLAGVSCQKEPAKTTEPEPTPTDRYENAKTVTLSQLATLKQGDALCVKNVTSLAKTTTFTLITDGTGYCATTAELAVGKKATVKGVLGNVMSTYGAITECDLYDVADSDYQTPEPREITSDNVSDFTESEVTFVSIKGVSGDNGEIVSLAVGKATASIVCPLSELNFSSLKGHNVTVSGYAFYTGEAQGIVVIATAVVDEGLQPVTERLAEWEFSVENMSIYGPTFTGADTEPADDGSYTAAEDKTAGDGGKYVAATTGNAKISYVNVDKSSITQKSKTTVNRIIGKTGEPYVTGVWAGDYWLFDVTLGKTYAAGSTVDFGAVFRSSNGSMKYWMLEIKDGEDWKPMLDTKSVDKDGVTVTYNCEQVGADYLEVTSSYKLTTEAANSLQIRYRCMGTYKASDGSLKTELDGGTHRIAGDDKYIKPHVDITYTPAE